jgi:hypothetical protein
VVAVKGGTQKLLQKFQNFDHAIRCMIEIYFGENMHFMTFLKIPTVLKELMDCSGNCLICRVVN